ncbi:MAG: 16S rRNA (adenine(1518)-N(6)/adenine(1519)-N(6))-dimethyltransferase RsmA [Acidimicrobiia bacterium]|nr:16S rRNA (adenine(1518)-N(6)/adenine(1519)-N(6))-dimethyltransferase RsmA [Acidimicrobiia bacterium]
MTHSRPTITTMLARHGVAPTKALGQNFVADPNTVRRIARLARVGPGDHVVEIGGGLGSLSLALIETGAHLVVVEVDPALAGALRELLADPADATVEVVEADALELDWPALLAGAPRWVLVANLPYNVATPVVLDVLDHAPSVERMVVMVQREAGERLVAEPGSKDYGIPSVKVAYHATARLVGSVPASVFVPRPSVASVLVEITRRPAPVTDADPKVLFGLVRHAFSQRRKMLRRSLAGRVDVEVLTAAGIDPTDRPEQIGVEAWGRLARAVAADGS